MKIALRSICAATALGLLYTVTLGGCGERGDSPAPKRGISKPTVLTPDPKQTTREHESKIKETDSEEITNYKFPEDFSVHTSYQDIPMPARWNSSTGAVTFDEASSRFHLNPGLFSESNLTSIQLEKLDALVERMTETIIAQAKKGLCRVPDRTAFDKQFDRFTVTGDAALAHKLRDELLAASIGIAGETEGRLAAWQIVGAANTDPILRGFGLLDADLIFETLDSRSVRTNIRQSWSLSYDGVTTFDSGGTAEGLGGFKKLLSIE